MVAIAQTATPRLQLGPIFREAVLAALVALVLSGPIMGLQTADASGGQGLVLNFRPAWVLWSVGVVFVGRLLLGFWWAHRAGRAVETPRALKAVGAALARIQTPLGFAGVGFAIALPFLWFADRYVIDVATTVLIYVMLGWGLNVVVGLAGLLDLGYVAFYAVGAYSFALLAHHFQFTFWEALPLAGAFAAFFGIILGFPVLRLRGDYLAIVTLGFGEIIRIVLINWWQVTGGPNGISNIPRPTFFGMPFQRNAPEGVTTFHQFFGLEFSPEHRIVFLYFVILALALVTNLFTLRLRRLPIGRAWEALREDEIACRALGINPTNTKLSAFAIGAMLGGFAGAFFATRQGFISPESFTFIESAIILAIVVLGGMGSQTGVVLAAIVLVTLPEFGRQFAEFRMLLFGAAMVAIMVWRPRGLLAHREPSVRLHPKGSGA
jgi:branched-chain amino acid transport system permease protein